VADLAVVIVSYNSREWLAPCLTSIAQHAGEADVEVILVDNDSTDGSADLVERDFPGARVLRGRNGGFAYGNNRGLLATDAPYVLFLNADAEIAEGTLSGLLDELRARPDVGLLGCRQLAEDGTLFPTIRRFPTWWRLLFEALGSEQVPALARRLGMRELDRSRYAGEVRCDWVTGSFMLARREAVLAAGLMDERFFLFCEEPDLCMGIKRAGWDIAYVPAMTVFHAFGKAGFDGRLVAQEAYAHKQYLAKHASRAARVLGVAALCAGHALRGLVGGRDAALRADRRSSSRRALRTLLGLEPPPFGAPAAHALEAPGAAGDGRRAGTPR
jgi:GT2 family glycosyltransferase